MFSTFQATTLLSHYETAWRHTQQMHRSRCLREVAGGSEQRLSVQYTAHHFLHEDTLNTCANQVKPSPISEFFCFKFTLLSSIENISTV